jgi:hypothetical protein
MVAVVLMMPDAVTAEMTGKTVSTWNDQVTSAAIALPAASATAPETMTV